MFKKFSFPALAAAVCVLLFTAQGFAAPAQNGTAKEPAANATLAPGGEKSATAANATGAGGNVTGLVGNVTGLVGNATDVPGNATAAGNATAMGNATVISNISGAGTVSGDLPPTEAKTLSAGEPESPLFSWGGYFKGIGAMLLVLAALWGVVWFLRRKGSLPGMGGLPRDMFRVEAQLALSPKKKIILVRFLNSRLLLCVTDQQITLLKEVEGPDDREESTESRARSFADVIAAAGQKNDAS